MKKIFLVLSVILAVSCSNGSIKETVGHAEREVPGTELTSWSLSMDGRTWQQVTIPHSYNSADGHSTAYYRGKATYRTALPKVDGPVFLLFEGAAQSATILLDGEQIAEHRGGYTPFTIDLTGRLDTDGKQLDVICDNHEDTELIPVSSDFNKNGGLHNPVWLLTPPMQYFSPQAYGMYRMHVTQHDVSHASANAVVSMLVCNAQDEEVTRDIEWVLEDADGNGVLNGTVQAVIPASGEKDVSWSFNLPEPHLWDGLADPYLYTLSATMGEDHAETEIGFRFYSIDRDKGFSLNGHPYPLRGVSMHQDMDGKASALTYSDYDRDYETVKELGCNFLRLAHYPHNDYALRLCDRMGIIVQTEIPWVNICGTRATDAYFSNIHQQMEEMITNLYNHPSIVFWGMWNELDSWGNRESLQGPLDARRVVDETARLYAFAKQLDPTRYVGLTDDSVFKRDFYTELEGDYYSENRYYGWYYNYNDFSGFTDDAHWIHDTMGVTNISEYGAGINPYCHTWDEKAVRRDRTDSLHFEEYGNRIHESMAQQIAQMPFLNFTSLWILFDFPVADRKEGFTDSSDGVEFTVNEDRKYMNDKGLVTRNRATRKDVFYLYKAWWNKSEETVYIAGRRLESRPSGQSFTLTVYSNATSLKVYADGKLVAEKNSSGEPTGVIWKFEGLQMGKSDTTFKVKSGNGTTDKVTFKALPPII